VLLIQLRLVSDATAKFYLQKSVFLVKIIGMVRMISFNKSKPFIVSPPNNNLKLGTIASHVVSHLVYDEFHVRWRRNYTGSGHGFAAHNRPLTPHIK